MVDRSIARSLARSIDHLSQDKKSVLFQLEYLGHVQAHHAHRKSKHKPTRFTVRAVFMYHARCCLSSLPANTVSTARNGSARCQVESGQFDLLLYHNSFHEQYCTLRGPYKEPNRTESSFDHSSPAHQAAQNNNTLLAQVSFK